MSPVEAIQIIESDIEECTVDQVIEAWQHLLDTGVLFSLQGCYQRAAHKLIEDGVIG
jgi:hypothetical protein